MTSHHQLTAPADPSSRTFGAGVPRPSLLVSPPSDKREVLNAIGRVRVGLLSFRPPFRTNPVLKQTHNHLAARALPLGTFTCEVFQVAHQLRSAPVRAARDGDFHALSHHVVLHAKESPYEESQSSGVGGVGLSTTSTSHPFQPFSGVLLSSMFFNVFHARLFAHLTGPGIQGHMEVDSRPCSERN